MQPWKAEQYLSPDFSDESTINTEPIVRRGNWSTSFEFQAKVLGYWDNSQTVPKFCLLFGVISGQVIPSSETQISSALVTLFLQFLSLTLPLPSPGRSCTVEVSPSHDTTYLRAALRYCLPGIEGRAQMGMFVNRVTLSYLADASEGLFLFLLHVREQTSPQKITVRFGHGES